MPKFFVEKDLLPAKTDGPPFLLDGTNSRHITGSLRMRAGDVIILCDGQGLEYTCRIHAIDAQGAWAVADAIAPSQTEPEVLVQVFQALPKGDKLEQVIQKCTELGAHAFFPVLTSRCIAKPQEKSAEKKQARLQRIALEAAQQSGRARVPKIHPVLGFEAAIASALHFGDAILFYEAGGESLRTLLPECGTRLSFFVGPEGGFTPEEVALATAHGVQCATLGKRILRTETAPVAALSAIFYEKGALA